MEAKTIISASEFVIKLESAVCKMPNSSPDCDLGGGSSLIYNDSGYFTNINNETQSLSASSEPSEASEEASLHSKQGECAPTIHSTNNVYFCEDAVFDEPKLEGPPLLCDNSNNYEEFSSLIKFSLEDTSSYLTDIYVQDGLKYSTNHHDISSDNTAMEKVSRGSKDSANVLQYFDHDSLSSYSSINASQSICVSEINDRQLIISQAVEKCLTGSISGAEHPNSPPVISGTCPSSNFPNNCGENNVIIQENFTGGSRNFSENSAGKCLNIVQNCGENSALISESAIQPKVCINSENSSRDNLNCGNLFDYNQQVVCTNPSGKVLLIRKNNQNSPREKVDENNCGEKVLTNSKNNQNGLLHNLENVQENLAAEKVLVGQKMLLNRENVDSSQNILINTDNNQKVVIKIHTNKKLLLHNLENNRPNLISENVCVYSENGEKILLNHDNNLENVSHEKGNQKVLINTDNKMLLLNLENCSLGNCQPNLTSEKVGIYSGQEVLLNLGNNKENFLTREKIADNQKVLINTDTNQRVLLLNLENNQMNLIGERLVNNRINLTSDEIFVNSNTNLKVNSENNESNLIYGSVGNIHLKEFGNCENNLNNDWKRDSGNYCTQKVLTSSCNTKQVIIKTAVNQTSNSVKNPEVSISDENNQKGFIINNCSNLECKPVFNNSNQEGFANSQKVPVNFVDNCGINSLVRNVPKSCTNQLNQEVLFNSENNRPNFQFGPVCNDSQKKQGVNPGNNCQINSACKNMFSQEAFNSEMNRPDFESGPVFNNSQKLGVFPENNCQIIISARKNVPQSGSNRLNQEVLFNPENNRINFESGLGFNNSQKPGTNLGNNCQLNSACTLLKSGSEQFNQEVLFNPESGPVSNKNSQKLEVNPETICQLNSTDKSEFKSGINQVLFTSENSQSNCDSGSVFTSANQKPLISSDTIKTLCPIRKGQPNLEKCTNQKYSTYISRTYKKSHNFDSQKAIKNTGNNQSVSNYGAVFPNPERTFNNSSQKPSTNSANNASGLNHKFENKNSNQQEIIDPKTIQMSSCKSGLSDLEPNSMCNLTSQVSSAPSENLPNPELSPDLFSEDDETLENEPSFSADCNNSSFAQRSLIQDENLLSADRKLLKRVQETLSGVPPPPSVTILQITVSEMLEKLRENKQLFNNPSETAVKTVESEVQSNRENFEEVDSATNEEKVVSGQKSAGRRLSSGDLKKNSKSLLIVNSKEEVENSIWPDTLNCRFHGLHYNRGKVSEDLEQYCAKYAARYVGAETASSCTVWSMVAPNSATKRRNARLRWGVKSPGRRLSHLARRRITFSSSNLQQASSNLSVIGNLSGSRQLMIDARKSALLQKRKSPRKSPWKRSPRKSPQKRIRTPGSSAKKRAARRLALGFEDDSKPGFSRVSSTKRALFQSPEHTRSTTASESSQTGPRHKSARALFLSPSKKSGPSTTNSYSFADENSKSTTMISDSDASSGFVERKKKRTPTKSLFFSPTKKSPVKSNLGGDRKRKRVEEMCHPNKFPRSLSFDVHHSSALNAAVSGGAALQRRNSEVIARPSVSRGELSDLHRKKMLWAVSEALRGQQISMSHPQFRQFATVLCKIVKNLMPDLMANGPRPPGSTSDRMLRIAHQHCYAVTRGKSFEEIMQQVKESTVTRKNLKPPQGYVPLGTSQTCTTTNLGGCHKNSGNKFNEVAKFAKQTEESNESMRRVNLKEPEKSSESSVNLSNSVTCSADSSKECEKEVNSRKYMKKTNESARDLQDSSRNAHNSVKNFNDSSQDSQKEINSSESSNIFNDSAKGLQDSLKKVHRSLNFGESSEGAICSKNSTKNVNELRRKNLHSSVKSYNDTSKGAKEESRRNINEFSKSFNDLQETSRNVHSSVKNFNESSQSTREFFNSNESSETFDGSMKNINESSSNFNNSMMHRNDSSQDVEEIENFRKIDESSTSEFTKGLQGTSRNIHFTGEFTNSTESARNFSESSKIFDQSVRNVKKSARNLQSSVTYFCDSLNCAESVKNFNEPLKDFRESARNYTESVKNLKEPEIRSKSLKKIKSARNFDPSQKSSNSEAFEGSKESLKKFRECLRSSYEFLKDFEESAKGSSESTRNFNISLKSFTNSSEEVEFLGSRESSRKLKDCSKSEESSRGFRGFANPSKSVKETNEPSKISKTLSESVKDFSDFVRNYNESSKTIRKSAKKLPSELDPPKQLNPLLRNAQMKNVLQDKIMNIESNNLRNLTVSPVETSKMENRLDENSKWRNIRRQITFDDTNVTKTCYTNR